METANTASKSGTPGAAGAATTATSSPAGPQATTQPADVVRDRLGALVRERPWVALAAAATAGGVLGGLVFSKFARLAFVATAGVVVHELWHREGAFDLQSIFKKA